MSRSTPGERPPHGPPQPSNHDPQPSPAWLHRLVELVERVGLPVVVAAIVLVLAAVALVAVIKL